MGTVCSLVPRTLPSVCLAGLKNGMDVLSEVLKVVKLEGAIYYNGEFPAPWSFRAPPSSVLAPHFAPGGGHVIIYHLLTEGQGFAGLEHGKRVPLTAGDIVIFPHGDPHIIGNGAPVAPVDQEHELHRIFAQGLRLARAGGGGEVTKFVCAYMSCDPQLSRVFLAGFQPSSKSMFETAQRGGGWRTPFVSPSRRPMPRAPAERP